MLSTLGRAPVLPASRRNDALSSSRPFAGAASGGTTGEGPERSAISMEPLSSLVAFAAGAGAWMATCVPVTSLRSTEPLSSSIAFS